MVTQHENDIVLNNHFEPFKFSIVGDPHMMGQNPINRLDHYPTALLNKFKEIFHIAQEQNLDAIFCLGDLFHTAEAALSTVGNLADVLRNSPVPIFSIIGNHDIIGGNLSTYLRTGIGLLHKLNIIHLIFDDNPLYFVKGNLKVQVTGRSYHVNIDHRNPELDYCVKKENGATHAIHLAHGYLTDRKLLFSHTLVRDIAALTEADATFSGHLHTPFSVYVDNKFFGNPGALGRITAAKAELRQPQIFICSIHQDGRFEIETYELKSAAKAEEVLDRSALEEEDIHFYKMNEFLQNVQSFSGYQIMNPSDLIHAIANAENIEEEIRQDALQEISRAEIELLGG